MSGSVFSLASELKDRRTLPDGLIQSSVLSVSAMVASARFWYDSQYYDCGTFDGHSITELLSWVARQVSLQ